VRSIVQALKEGYEDRIDMIKLYSLNPPTLVPPTLGHPLILYLAMQKVSMGCMLG